MAAERTFFAEAARAEMRRHSSRMVMEAGVAMSNYNATRWIGRIDVPTEVVITAKDRAIAPITQAQMALARVHVGPKSNRRGPAGALDSR